MKRSSFNFVIDSIGFAAFAFLTATGVLVRYVLPPGSGHHTTLWGMDRHEWGSVHFWLAVVFLGVMALHVFLHWRWVVTVLRGRPREGSGVRLALGCIGLLAVVGLALAPFAGPVERAPDQPEGRGESSRYGREAGYEPDREAGHESDHEPGHVRGRMTLAEIEQATGVPAAHLIGSLGLPDDVPLDAGVGKLGREYGFEVDDVRAAVQAYQTGQREPDAL